MTRRHLFLYIGLCLLLLVGVASCRQHDPDKEGIPAGLTGVDYLADHVSVQRFTVNGVSGAQAGKGGSTVCCVMLPRQWQPGMTVKVTWNVTNWRDCTGKDYEAVVPVDKYDEAGHVWVSFLPKGKVRVTASAWHGPGNPKYPGPHREIPKKFPWKVWPPHEHCPELYN